METEKIITQNYGHGLTNMRKRSEEIGAEFSISSSPQKGTIIKLIKRMT